jgi:hypothetical protein
VGQLPPDQKVKVTVLRDGKKLSLDVVPRPAPPEVIVRRQELRGGARGPDGGQGPGARGPGQPGFNGPGGPGPEGNARPFIQQGQPGRNGLGNRQNGPLDLQRVLPELLRDGDSDARFGGAELASLSERLGSYFGVKAGVLVVRAGVDSPFKLQDGDVILAVDGREVSSAQQAGRILRSYQPGEKLTLKLQRDRKVQNIDVTAPGGRKPD